MCRCRERRERDGGREGGREEGIIPLPLPSQASAGVEFSLRISYMEVYKEELRDLLDGGMSAREIHIREDEWGNTGESARSGGDT